MLREPSPHDSAVAIVTGAAGAMGRSIVMRLAERRYRVVATDRDSGVLKLFSQTENIVPVVADLGDENGVKTLLSHSAYAIEEVQVLVNNAGVLSNHKVADTSIEEWRQVLAVNLDGAFLLTQHCVEAMRRNRYGRIVNMCSAAMKTGGLTAGTAYSVSKGALGALTLTLARETAGDGITVNAIAPAYVSSPMVTAQLSEAQRQSLLATIPVGRFCEPEEIAHAVDFLVSPLAGFITGEILDINGGLHLD